jgi:hypothetical protein
MEAGLSPARQARAHHRHELHTLIYVTLDQANGGIVRNLTHEGIGAQVVAAVRPRQQLRIRFELRYPRLRVETRGEVMWATFSGQCGIRFLDLSPHVARQIDEWIFGNLLDGAALHEEERNIFGQPTFGQPILGQPRFGEPRSAESKSVESKSVESRSGHLGSLHVASRGSPERSEEDIDEESVAEEDDGLLVSAGPRKVIELLERSEQVPTHPGVDPVSSEFLASEFPSPEIPTAETPDELDWLSRPLSSNGLAWTVNSLVVVAGLLLFALVFLVVTRELPKWPLPMICGAAMFVTCFYWAFFKLFGGTSAGKRLARLAGYQEEEEAVGARFR